MTKSKIIFSNGEELILNEGDVLVSVNSYKFNEEFIPSMNASTILESTFHDGLIPSILKVVLNNPYFHGPDGIDTIYNSASIVKIENI